MPFFTGGFIGVNVFYVLSGYLITSLLLRERTRTGRVSLGRFWGRRMLRLYPTLLAVTIVAACLWFLVGSYDGANVDAWTALFLALTYTANVGRWIFHQSMGVLSQTWSLAMEEQFYLLWPPVLALLLARRANRVATMSVLAVLIVGSSVLGGLLYVPRGGTATPDIYFSPILNAAPLLTGCLLGLALVNQRFAALHSGRVGLVLTWAGAVGLIAIEVSIVSGWQKHAATFGLVLPLAGLASAALIAGLVSRATAVSRLLALAPIAWFGRNASYSLYLWHILVFALVLPLVPGIAGKFGAIGLSAVVAVVSHFAIERPVAKLRSRISHQNSMPKPVRTRTHPMQIPAVSEIRRAP